MTLPGLNVQVQEFVPPAIYNKRVAKGESEICALREGLAHNFPVIMGDVSGSIGCRILVEASDCHEVITEVWHRRRLFLYSCGQQPETGMPWIWLR